MNANESYLLNQVFSVVIVAMLGITFYILAATGFAAGFAAVVSSLLLIIISIVCLAILSELSKLNCTLSKRNK